MPRHIIIIPVKAVLPEGITIPVVEVGSLIDRLYAATDEEIILPVTTRELQLLIEYRDLLDLSIRAVIGLSGAMYNTIWNTYISTLTRITTDTLLYESKEQADESSNAGQNPESTQRTRQTSVVDLTARRASKDEDDTGEIS